MGCTESHLTKTPRDQILDLRVPVGSPNGICSEGPLLNELLSVSGRSGPRDPRDGRISKKEPTSIQNMRPIFAGVRQTTKNLRPVTDKFGNSLQQEYYDLPQPKRDLFWSHKRYMLVSFPNSQQIQKDNILQEGRIPHHPETATVNVRMGYCGVECSEAAMFSPSTQGGQLTHLISEDQDSVYMDSQPGVSYKSLMNTPKCSLQFTNR